MADNTEQDDVAPEEEKSGKGKLIVIVAVVAFLVIGGAGGAWFFLGQGEDPAAAEAGGPEEPSEFMVSLDTFVVNLADPGGRRYLKVTVRAITDDESLDSTLQQDDILRSKIRDRVITVLASKSLDNVATPVGKEGLRRQLLREVNGVLPEPAVSELLFVEFVVQ